MKVNIMIVCITGTPGAGKTYLARKLTKEGFKHISGIDVIRKYRITEYFDRKRSCIVVDKKRFVASMLRECQGDCVVDSHLSHNLPRKKVSLCIVCKCELKKLYRRLKKRGYSQGKIRENLDSEIFDVCFDEAISEGHEVITYEKESDYGKILKKIRSFKKFD